jgi:hypothetical protein
MKKIDEIKKIAVFDFDGTLIMTPTPDDGKLLYKMKTGNDWPHKGWWGQKDSLDTTIFDIPANQKVVDDYRAN